MVHARGNRVAICPAEPECTLSSGAAGLLLTCKDWRSGNSSMPQEPSLKDLFPPLEETAHSRDSLIDALRNEVALPSPEVAVAAFYVEDIEQDILDVLDRARVSELDLPDIRLLFRGLHILGGRRRPTGFPALVAFLRGPFERVDEVFSETITDTSVQAIVAGMFNGDIDLLMGLITDREIDPLVREATMRAFVCLVIDGRIERPFAADFLRRFDEERMAPPGDAPWHAWATAVALLRFEELSQRVHAAYADDRVPHVFTTVTDFDALLAAALQQPNDPELMNEERVGYIEDVLATLQECDSWGDDEDDPFELSPDDRYNDDDDTDFDRLGPEWRPPVIQEPVRNPLRRVGRNDPCPCGSGKKFKKCCLTTS
jgi:hypothetical protein